MRASPTQESANSLYPSPLMPPQNSRLEASSTDTPGCGPCLRYPPLAYQSWLMLPAIDRRDKVCYHRLRGWLREQTKRNGGKPPI